MTRQVRINISPEKYDEWQAKIMAQKKVRGVERKTPSDVERSASTPSELRGNGNHAETTTRGLKNGPSPYKSKLEAQYAAHLDLLVKAGEIRRWSYEPMSLKLSQGKRYRPDFLVVMPFGMEAKAELHEVKGKWTMNRRDGMTHLKWAAQLYGDVFTFRLIEWKGHGFDGSYVVV